jgi:hypothetical protein
MGENIEVVVDIKIKVLPTSVDIGYEIKRLLCSIRFVTAAFVVLTRVSTTASFFIHERVFVSSTSFKHSPTLPVKVIT